MSTRRVFVEQLHVGLVELNQAEAKHARDVLRLIVGDQVSLFDPAGNAGQARLTTVDKRQVVAQVDRIDAPVKTKLLTVVSSTPKGERADWLVEKLSEIGVSVWQPVVCGRSVVEPGKGKLDRWRRIAIEAAKQSGRVGVMRIEPAVPLTMVKVEAGAVVLNSELAIGDAIKMGAAVTQIFVGPEGGWEPAELESFRGTGVRAIRLPTPILRVETACVVAAGLAMCHIPENL